MGDDLPKSNQQSDYFYLPNLSAQKGLDRIETFTAHWFQDHLEVFNWFVGQSTMYSEPLEEVGDVPRATHVLHQVVEEATPLLHLLLLPHLLVVEAKGSSPQEVREVPGTTHVLHRVVEEADGVHSLGLSN